jgi:hypothetical protein
MLFDATLVPIDPTNTAGFLAQHLPDLLTPQPLPYEVAALAGVAHHLIKVCSKSVIHVMH